MNTPKKLFSALIVTLGLSTSAWAQETTTLRLSNWLPPSHFIVQEMLTPWAADVEQATEGRVKVEFINALGKPASHLDLVRNGVADVAMSVHTYTSSRFPLVEFAELPFTVDSGEINSVAYWRTYQKYMLDANEHKGIKLLGTWTSPASVIFTTKESVKALADLNGLKLRSPSPIFDAIGAQLGATMLNAPASESYEMLSRGVIDGLYFQHDQIANFNLQKLVKNVVVVDGGFGHSSQYLFMNQKKWDAISKADQAAIDKVSGEHVARTFGRKWNQAEIAAIKSVADAGVKTVQIQGAELDGLKAKLAFLETDWIAAANKKNVDGKAALAYYHEQIAELKKATD
ncbi:MAG: TRAP transporter substrate-binding protein [Burkholderiaceae bacterium]|nr:TRAP transporter substrate-binding protein [Burkholderiaceae bacterium]